MELQFDYSRMKDAPSDPVTFADIMFDHFKEIDINKDNKMSSGELSQFLDTADPNSDVYATGLVVLANYDLFSKLTARQRSDSLDREDFDEMEYLTTHKLPENYVLSETLNGAAAAGTTGFVMGGIAGAIAFGGLPGGLVFGCVGFIGFAPVGAAFAYGGARNEVVNRQLLANLGFQVKE